MPVTLKDIAEELGLSVSTVSRVLNGKGFVSDETRRTILAKAQTLNYHPNQYARSLRTQTYRTIGVMVPNVVNPYYNSLLQGIEEKCRRENYSVLIGVSNHNREREREYIDVLISNRVAGLALASYDREADYTTLQRSGVNVVSLNEHALEEEVDWVAVDNCAAMSDLTQYMLNLSHRSIACLYGSNDNENATARMRYQGFLDCMHRNGVPVDPQWTLDAGLHYETGHRAAQQLLCLPKMPTAILCHNNSVAVGAYNVLTEAGYSVPEDISIACFDAIIPNNVIARRFTCIMQPIEQIACNAVDAIINRDACLTGDSKYVHKMFPHTLIVGDTTRPQRA